MRQKGSWSSSIVYVQGHASRNRCTSLVCTSGCTSGQGFPIISFENRADYGRICEICTQKRRSENDFPYKSDLYDYHFRM